MPIIDLKEIPEAHTSSGEQDTFELFARDFFEYLGYGIISGPGRGADGGADLIIEEVRKGIGGETKVRWLVSCKHNAHSGRSVIPGIESDILDRVNSKSCKGFVGFYSTLPSSSLNQRLDGLRHQIEVQVFDAKEIEKCLLKTIEGISLAKRYFPESLKLWLRNNPSPVQLFSDSEGLKCQNCGRDLLSEKNGIVVAWERVDWHSEETHTHYISDVYWCCKGECDQRLKHIHKNIYPDHADGWEDIPDICIPTVYIKWVMSAINRLHAGCVYSDNAFKQTKKLLLEIFPYVVRDLTDEENEQLRILTRIPSFLGGMGE